MSLLSGVPNFRDLGGHATRNGGRIRRGALYRSGVLADLTPADSAALERLGIRLIVDLRSARERRLIPGVWNGRSDVEILQMDLNVDLQADNLELLQIIRADPTAAGASRMVRRVYTLMPGLCGRHLPALFERLASPDFRPALIHCTAGKDRTGFVMALILSVLGVSEETIMRDYLLTQQLLDRPKLMAATSARLTRILGAAPGQDLLDTLLSTRPEFLQASFIELASRHGSVAAYCRDIGGLDEAKAQALRRSLSV